MSELATILEYLSEDCWRHVLDYVPVQDIIRSERTSRRWQRVVLEYLSHVRIGMLLVKDPYGETGYSLETVPNVRWVRIAKLDIESFQCWTKKLGAAVVCAYCNEKSLKVIAENCFNLEAAVFERITDELLLNNRNENFTQLQELIFEDCDISDECLNQLIGSVALQKLQIRANNIMTGQCLVNIKSTKLKSLILKECPESKAGYLTAASRDRLSELTKFVLYMCCNEEADQLREDLMLMLENMPKLEHLNVFLTQSIDDVFEGICRLQNLRFLSVCVGVTDADLEALGRSCQELRHLDIDYCPDVTIRGLAAVGPRLSSLTVYYSHHLTDDDVEALIRACPDLTELKVSRCDRVTPDVATRVAVARMALRARRPLCRPLHLAVDPSRGLPWDLYL